MFLLHQSKCNRFNRFDVFQIFRNTSLKNYGLSPSHYLSAPALSCDAMINMIKVQLELIPDADVCLVFEKGWEVEFFSFPRDIVKPTINI